MEIIASLPTEWNVETGNTAMMDLLQAHPEIEVVITANDYIAIGAALAAEALGREDVAIFGNDGDTTGLEDIAAGKWDATVNTTPLLDGAGCFAGGHGLPGRNLSRWLDRNADGDRRCQ